MHSERKAAYGPVDSVVELTFDVDTSCQLTVHDHMQSRQSAEIRTGTEFIGSCLYLNSQAEVLHVQKLILFQPVQRTLVCIIQYPRRAEDAVAMAYTEVS